MLNSKFELADHNTQAGTNDCVSDAGANLQREYPRTERIDTCAKKLQIQEEPEDSQQMSKQIKLHTGRNYSKRSSEFYTKIQDAIQLTNDKVSLDQTLIPNDFV